MDFIMKQKFETQTKYLWQKLRIKQCWFTLVCVALPFTIRKCDLLEGSTWLKCPHWLRGMVILTKCLGHEMHELFFTETFD